LAIEFLGELLSAWSRAGNGPPSLMNYDFKSLHYFLFTGETWPSGGPGFEAREAPRDGNQIE